MSDQGLKLISSMATREILAVLAAQYQKESGSVVVTEAAGGVDVARRISEGEQADVVVLSDAAIDKLLAAGKLLAGTRTDLVRSGIAIAVRSGQPHPDISDEAAVRRLVQTCRSVSFSTGPSGVYLEKLFARWGILEQVRSRIMVPPPGVPVGSLVASGEVALGFQQYSELVTLQGIDVLGPLPPEIQLVTVFTGAVAASSQRPDESRALLRYLASPVTSPVKRRFGMEAAT